MLAEQFRMLKGSEPRGNRQLLQGNLCPSRLWAEGQRGGPQRAGEGVWGRTRSAMLEGAGWVRDLKWFCCLIRSQRKLWRMWWCVLGMGLLHCRGLSVSELLRGWEDPTDWFCSEVTDLWIKVPSAGKEGHGVRWAVFEGKEGCSGDMVWEGGCWLRGGGADEVIV